MAAHLSLLIPHLGGKAYALRSAIVTATGTLIQKAYGDFTDSDLADAQGASLYSLHTSSLGSAASSMIHRPSSNQNYKFSQAMNDAMHLQKPATALISTKFVLIRAVLACNALSICKPSVASDRAE